MSDTLCDPYIWQDIKILPKIFMTTWSERKNGICHSELTNSILFWYTLAILFGVVTFISYESMYPAILILITATLILLPAFLAYGKIQRPVDEGRRVHRKKEAFTTYIEPSSETRSSPRNPFMNLLLDEIKYNPTRGPAANTSSPENKVLLDDFFRVQFTSDPTDVFGKTQSQRQFITMPSTTVPNDQASYRDWLYKIPGKTCKEGGREACLPGTDGGKIPWLNVDR